LVLLRLACAWIAFLVIARVPFAQVSVNASIVVSAALAVALAFGFGTRTVAFALAAAAVATAFMTDSTLPTIARACGCAALGLLGPGAYSIDANVFGRRVIRLEPRGRDRASDA
jgi:uncharacterized membrane protein YphA (DoxX/SURF4 family)